MKKVPGSIAAVTICIMMLLGQAVPAGATLYDAAVDSPEGKLLFPGDSIRTDGAVLVGPDRTYADLSEGIWTNTDPGRAYRVSGYHNEETGENGFLVDPEGYVVNVKGGVSFSDDGLEDTHLTLPSADAYGDYNAYDGGADPEREGEDALPVDVASYPEGTWVCVRATLVDEGKTFGHWEFEPQIYLEDIASSEVSFVMPGYALSVKAVYAESAPEENDVTDEATPEAEGWQDEATPEAEGWQDEATAEAEGWQDEATADAEAGQDDALMADEEFYLAEEQMEEGQLSEEMPETEVEEFWEEMPETEVEESWEEMFETEAEEYWEEYTIPENQEEYQEDYTGEEGLMDAGQPQAVDEAAAQEMPAAENLSTAEEVPLAENMNTAEEAPLAEDMNAAEEMLPEESLNVAEEAPLAEDMNTAEEVPAAENVNTAEVISPAENPIPGEEIGQVAEEEQAAEAEQEAEAEQAAGAEQAAEAEQAAGAEQEALPEQKAAGEGTAEASAPEEGAAAQAAAQEELVTFHQLYLASDRIIVNGEASSPDQLSLAEGETVELQAAADEERIFTGWSLTNETTGEQVYYEVLDETGRRISFGMPAGDVTAQAVYADPAMAAVQVTNGSGSGEYEQGSEVEIQASASPDGQQFIQWIVEKGNVAIKDARSAGTSFQMGDQAVSVKAVYDWIPYELIVSGGKGGGTWHKGDTVNISADWPADGKEFARWDSAQAVINPADRMNASLTMPGGNVTVTASYQDGPSAQYNRIEGLEEGAEYPKDTKLTFNAVGNGPDKQNPNPGDYKWVPSSYQIGTVTGGWSSSDYTTSMAISSAGTYTLTVTFVKQIFDGNIWNTTDQMDQKAVTFRVGNTQAVQTGDETPLSSLWTAAAAALGVALIAVTRLVTRRG